MTDEIDVVRKIICITTLQYDWKELMRVLYDHLSGSLVWILRYSDKNQIPLSNKEALMWFELLLPISAQHKKTTFAELYEQAKNKPTHNNKEFLLQAQPR